MTKVPASYTRPITVEEDERILSIVRECKRQQRSMLLSLILRLPAPSIIMLASIVLGETLFIVLGLVATGVVAAPRLTRLLRNHKRRTSLGQILMNGHVECLIVQASLCYYFSRKMGDEHFTLMLFQTSENEILSLGTWETTLTDELPNTAFELVWGLGADDKPAWQTVYTSGATFEIDTQLDYESANKLMSVLGHPHYMSFTENFELRFLSGNLSHLAETALSKV